MNRKQLLKRRSELITELVRMSHDNWRGDYAPLEAELKVIQEKLNGR